MMEPELIPYTNADGSTNGLRSFGSDSDPETVLLHFPALGVRAAKYDAFGSALAEAGFQVYTTDLRGKGASSIRPSKSSDFGYKEMLELDTKQAIATVRSLHPTAKLYLTGHSLGGQHACLYCARNKGAADGLVLIGSCSVYYKGWEGLSAFRILISTQMVGLLSRGLGYFPGKKVGFGGTNAKTMMVDWSNQSRTGDYRLTGDDFDYEKALATLDLPTLTINFEGDDYAPLKALHYLTDKFNASAPLKIIYMKRSDALNEGYNHFNWAEKPGGVVQVIGDWLGKRSVSV